MRDNTGGRLHEEYFLAVSFFCTKVFKMPRHRHASKHKKSKYDVIAQDLAMTNKRLDTSIEKCVAAHAPVDVPEAPKGIMTRRSSRTHQMPLLDATSTDTLELIMEQLLKMAETCHTKTRVASKRSGKLPSSRPQRMMPTAELSASEDDSKSLCNFNLQKISVVVDDLRPIEERRRYLKGILSLSTTCWQLYVLSKREKRRTYAVAMTDALDATHPLSLTREMAMQRVMERAQFDSWVRMHRHKALHCADPGCFCFSRRAECIDRWREMTNVRAGLFDEFECITCNDTPLVLDTNRSGAHVVADIDENLLWFSGRFAIHKAQVSMCHKKCRKVKSLPLAFVDNACAIKVSVCNKWLLSCSYQTSTPEAMDELYSFAVGQSQETMTMPTFFINQIKLASLNLPSADARWQVTTAADNSLVADVEASINQAFAVALRQIRIDYKVHLQLLLDHTSERSTGQLFLLRRALRDSPFFEAMQYCNASLTQVGDDLKLVICLRPDFWSNACRNPRYLEGVLVNALPIMMGFSVLRISCNLTTKKTTVEHINEFGCDLCRDNTFGQSHQVRFSQDGHSFVATAQQDGRIVDSVNPACIEEVLHKSPVGYFLILKVYMPQLNGMSSAIHSFVCQDVPMLESDPILYTKSVTSRILWTDLRRREMGVFLLVCKTTLSKNFDLQAMRLVLNTYDHTITTLDTLQLQPFVPTHPEGIAINPDALQVSVSPSGERVLVTVAAHHGEEPDATQSHHALDHENDEDTLTRMYGWMIDYGRDRKIKSFYPQCKSYHNLAWTERGIASTLLGGTLVMDMPGTHAYHERASSRHSATP